MKADVGVTCFVRVCRSDAVRSLAAVADEADEGGDDKIGLTSLASQQDA